MKFVMSMILVFLVKAVTNEASAQYPWVYAPYNPGYQPYPQDYSPYGRPATPPAALPSSATLRRAMLDAHNAIRARLGVPPLVWSLALAAFAQSWADKLIA